MLKSFFKKGQWAVRSKHLGLFYFIASLILAILIIVWFVLNHYRVFYYNDAYGNWNRASLYWKVIKSQYLLQWPILTMAAGLFLAAFCKIFRIPWKNHDKNNSRKTVTEFPDIVTSLLGRDDGSCRDINFESPTWKGVEDLLASLGSAYEEVSGTTDEGKDLIPPFGESAIAEARKGGSIHFLLHRGAGPIKNLQVFICSEKDGSPFVELTFFPEDVEQTTSLRSDFIEWAQQQQSLLEAERYYARYENASWHFGDIGAHSGVFLVSDEARTNA
jgi:hypothetical protein